MNNRTQRLVFARTPWFDDQTHPSSPQSTHQTAEVNRPLKPKVLGDPGLTRSKNATRNPGIARNKDATSSFLFLVAMHLLRFHPSNQRAVHHLSPLIGSICRPGRVRWEEPGGTIKRMCFSFGFDVFRLLFILFGLKNNHVCTSHIVNKFERPRDQKTLCECSIIVQVLSSFHWTIKNYHPQSLLSFEL